MKAFYIILCVVSIFLAQLLKPIFTEAMECPPPVQQFARDVINEARIKSDTPKLLGKILPSGVLENRTEVIVQDLYSKYPNADKLVMDHLRIYIACEIIKDAKDLGTQEKLDTFSNYLNTISIKTKKQSGYNLSEESIIVTREDCIVRTQMHLSTSQQAIDFCNKDILSERIICLEEVINLVSTSDQAMKFCNGENLPARVDCIKKVSPYLSTSDQAIDFCK